MEHRYWIFDLDGTITVPAHDFDAMKRRLGLPVALPLLEGLLGLRGARRDDAFAQVARWEHDLAQRAVASPGAVSLLQGLHDQGARLGVLTRNRRDLALTTLDVLGVGHLFRQQDVLGRDCVTPKPAPDGILRILHGWQGTPSHAVMVGDSVHDVRAGLAAGTYTVRISSAPCAEAHRTVGSLEALCAAPDARR